MSHFLEVYFLRRGEHIPLHGGKVGLGTLVSLHMYKRLKDVPQDFAGKEIADMVGAAAEKLVFDSTDAAYEAFLSTAEKAAEDAENDEDK